MPPLPLRYAIYTRQSTAAAGKVLSSCDAQFAICEDFMRCYGMIIYRLDRLSRNLRDSVGIFEALHENNVKLIIVTAPEVGAAASDRLLLNLMSSFAEFCGQRRPLPKNRQSTRFPLRSRSARADLVALSGRTG